MKTETIDINTVAMSVILYAGNARESIDEALEALESLDFSAAEKLLDKADEQILKAHNSQTSIIQRQAAGEDLEYSLLFIHAQDTMMTINTEFRLTKKLLPIFKALSKQAGGEK
ncbi:PTS lactose/cellobiose transporter subunit IIA [Enterococcus sp. DIV0970a]|uniref:PTS lactose/cellobiose transporter subunit IIA n=1 Tax=unclassified Enterococcus TaxID=2608891 RepID=UPI003F214896